MFNRVNMFLSMCLMMILSTLTFNAYAQVGIDEISFLQQVLEYIQLWGGFNWAAKVAGGIFLLVGAMKLSFASKIFDFFGSYKPMVPVLLALIAGVVSLAIDPGSSISWAGVVAYITAGAGAILLNQILDMVKAIPGIGSMVITVIDFLQIFLRSKSPLESKHLAAKAEMKKELSA